MAVLSTTTIEAGPIFRFTSRIVGRPLRRAFTPRLDVAALRRGDLRRPPRWMPGCRIRPVRFGTVGGTQVLAGEITPRQPSGGFGQGGAARTLVYVHGGAYVAGPNLLEWYAAAALCRALGVRTLLPLYRRAPEHPFPAAFDDIATVLDSLAVDGAGQVLLAGDSAGGGLAAAIAVHRDDVARLGLISPWVDVTLDADDIDDSRDAVLATPGLQEAGRRYADRHDPSDPRLSPLHADLSKLPPTIVLVGTDEVLLPDVRRFTHRAQAAGADVRHIEGRGVPHAWGIIPLAPEAVAAREMLAEHLAS